MPTDLQSVSFNHSDTCPYFCCLTDPGKPPRGVEPRSEVYKTPALTAVLRRLAPLRAAFVPGLCSGFGTSASANGSLDTTAADFPACCAVNLRQRDPLQRARGRSPGCAHTSRTRNTSHQTFPRDTAVRGWKRLLPSYHPCHHGASGQRNGDRQIRSGKEGRRKRGAVAEEPRRSFDTAPVVYAAWAFDFTRCFEAKQQPEL